MATGKKYIVSYYTDSANPSGVIKSVDFTGTFHYDTSYTNSIVVSVDDQSNKNPFDTSYKSYVVTYYWDSASGPNLGTVTVATLLSTAVSDVATAISNGTAFLNN